MHGVALHGLPISEVVIATCKKGASPTDPFPLYIILAALAGPCGSSSTPFGHSHETPGWLAGADCAALTRRTEGRVYIGPYKVLFCGELRLPSTLSLSLGLQLCSRPLTLRGRSGCRLSGGVITIVVQSLLRQGLLQKGPVGLGKESRKGLIGFMGYIEFIKFYSIYRVLSL